MKPTRRQTAWRSPAAWLPVLKKNYHQVLLVFAAFTVMVLTGHFFVRGILSNRLLTNSKDTLNTAEANVRAAFAEADVSLLNAASTILDMIEDGKDNGEILTYLKRTNHWLLRNGGFVGLYGLYGFVRGEFVDALEMNPGPDYIPQTRPWYQAAVRSGGGTAYTPPYTDMRTGNIIITAVRTINAGNGEIYGVLALDMNVSWIGEYAKGLRLASGGYGMLLSQYLTIMFHPDESILGLQLQEAGGDFTDIARRLRLGEEISGKRIINYHGVPVIAFFRPIYNGWHLGLLTPVRAYYRDLTLAAFILSFAGLILALILSFILLQVSAARMKADEENISKTSFLARMSHEIRTPMNAIIGMSELAMREQLTPQVRDYVGNIRQAGNNLLSIINDILDFSKIESGKLEITRNGYCLASVLNDAISIICMRLDEKPVLFLTEIDSSLPNALCGDDVRIRQVLLNLLSNAVKYTREGSIVFSAHGETLSPPDSEGGGEIRLVFKIADTGIGIKSEDAGKLFGEFQQFDVGRNRGIEGTGLGLAISKNLCRLMGGDITVESVYGQGSVFTASVIQTIRDSAAIACVEQPETKSVLVYDNRQVQARSIVRAIENLGVNCALADSREDFTERFSGGAWQFIVTSPALCSEVQAALKEKQSAAAPVLLAEYGEISRYDLPVIAMPVQPWALADILNGRKNALVCHETEKQAMLFTAPQARILVVDDIATNLAVVTGLLAPWKMTIDTAAGGIEAVHLVQHNQYDAVLMDHMMPDMDGIEAAGQIRAWEDAQAAHTETPRRVPIIALTANAVSGMKEMFLEKGFDDFISKPIDISKLDDLMDRWIPKEKREKAIPAKHAQESAAFDIPGVNVKQGIALTGGTEAGYRQVMNMFRKDAKERLPLLRNFLAENNNDEPPPGNLAFFTTQVHALKSASASIGAAEVSAKAAALEAAGKAGNLAAIRANLPAFTAQLAELVEEIEKAAAGRENGREENQKKNLELGMGSSDHKIPNPALQILNLLDNLSSALEAQKVEDIDSMLDELNQKTTDPEIHEILDAVSDYVLMAEFDKALEQIKILTTGKTGEKNG